MIQDERYLRAYAAMFCKFIELFFQTAKFSVKKLQSCYVIES